MKNSKKEYAKKNNLPNKLQIGQICLCEKKVWIIGGIAGLLAVTVIIVGLVTRKENQEKAYQKVETPYIDLLISAEIADYISDDESTYGNVYTRTFYLNYNDDVLPLWRVDFGDPYAGDWVGILQTEQGDIPVVMTGFAISAEELAALGEEGSQLYGECMQGYSVMLEGIMSDPRFTSERPLAVGENTEIKLTYWNVTLPSKMKVMESSEGDNYTATFSGEVVGEMVLLYRIIIGDEQTGSLLGYYKVDGVKKAVCVESFTLVERESWNEDDYAAAYRMMDTINHVIETIKSSKEFTAEAE